VDVLLRKPRQMIGTCDIPQNYLGRYYVRILRSANGSYTRLRYRFGLLYDAKTESLEMYIICHGLRDAKILPNFKFQPSPMFPMVLKSVSQAPAFARG